MTERLRRDKPTSKSWSDVSSELSNVYPAINPTILIREKEKKKFIAVVIYGSSDRPHFAGKAYIRDGTSSVEASKSQFERLIAMRTDKVSTILQWKDREVTLSYFSDEPYTMRPVEKDTVAMRLYDCNQFWVTVVALGNSPALTSFKMGLVELNFDHENRRLWIDVARG
jgi:hypothetical protein